MSYLRPYQIECRDETIAALAIGDRTLYVVPTGCGKTEIALDILDTWPDRSCDILCLAHREELIWQPWERYHKKTGQHAEMIMGEQRRSNVYGRSRVTFASKDSLYPERLRKEFPDPNKVGLIWADEAHHLTPGNKSYSHILDYFPKAKLFGCTATPDRTDEEALGQMFGSVAYEYPLLDPQGGASAIGDGWLVPIEQEYVVIEELEFNVVGTRGGDFIDGQLEKLMLRDKPLYRRTAAIQQLAGVRQSLLFAAGIKQAIVEASILNAARDGCAFAICSRVDEEDRVSFVVNSRDKDVRRRTIRRFNAGGFQYFCNVGVFTEGFDAPCTACISMGRPTKSRSLYAQMCGRGTRVLPDIIEGQRDDGAYWRLDDPAARHAAIAASGKPNLLVLDFVGNSRHMLISAADILGGKYPDAVVEAAKDKIQGGERNVTSALEQAEADLERETERRRNITARAKVQTRKVDPFSVLGVRPTREPGWHKGRKPTGKMKAALGKFKIPRKEIEKLSFHQASQLMDRLISRIKSGYCTYPMSRLLQKHGFNGDVPFEQAKATIDRVAASGWTLRGDGVEQKELV